MGYSPAGLGTQARGAGPSLTHRGGHLSPLQHHVLDDPAVRVDIDTLILVAQQHLHAVRVGEDDDRVGLDATLDLEKGDRAQGSTSAATSPPAHRLNKHVSCKGTGSASWW